MPWALLMAIGIVLAADVAMRFVPDSVLLFRSVDDDEVAAVRNHLMVDGPARVALLGSSQMQQAVAMPDFAGQLDAAMGTHTSTANYGIRGAKTEMSRYVARRWIAAAGPGPHAPAPPTLVLGISVRDLRGDDPDFTRMATLMTLSDWTHELSEHGTPLLAVLPTVVRNHVGHYSHLLRYRESLVAWARSRVIETETMPNIIRGEIAYDLRYRTRSLVSSPASRRTLLRRMGHSFDFTGKPEASPVMLAYLRDTIDDCRRNGVRLVLVEMPLPPVLKVNLPRGFYEGFRTAIDGLLRENPSVQFLPADEVMAEIPDKFYFDAQHLNYWGAFYFGDSLAKKLKQ